VGTAVGLLCVATFGLVQVWLHLGPPSFSVGGVTRAFGTFGQPNPFAGYLEVTVPLLVAVVGAWLVAGSAGLARRMIPAWLAALAAVAAVPGLVALVLTQSRGGWIGATVGLGAVVWLLGGRIRWAGVGAVAAVALVLVLTPLGGRVVHRLGGEAIGGGTETEVTVANFAVRERLAHWGAGIAMVRDAPWFGVGAGNFNRAYRDATPEWRFRVPRGHAHNAYIHAAAQTGLVGLVAYLAFVGAVGLRLRTLLRRAGDGAGRFLVVGAIGVSAAFATHNLFDYLHVHSLPIQLSVVWALAEIGGGVSFPASADGATATGVKPA
jgi:O-antigen ligase